MKRILLAVSASVALSLFNTDSAAVTFITNSTIASGNTSYEGQDVVVWGCTLTISGPHTFTSLRVVTNGTVSCPLGQLDTVDNRINLVITGNLIVDASSQISASGLGYSTGAGPGAPAGGPEEYASAGSYGGRGSGGSGPIYGNALAPTDFGSGGGGKYGGWSHGGGAIRLQVAGTLQLDGQITADGISANGNNAGGAGGSVWITTGTLVGAGRMSASGNAGMNGTGGGGRIAVYYMNGAGFTGFTNCLAHGSQSGTTCFFDTSVPNQKLSVFDNMVYDQASVLHYGAVSVANGGTLSLGGGTTLQVDSALTLEGNSTLIAMAKDTSGLVSNRWAGTGISLTAGSVVVGPGSKLTADGQGYTTGAGPGGPVGGVNDYGSAASHGGLGSGGSGPIYGDALAPTDLGSGGGGQYGGWSRGGGAIRLQVAGTLQLDGQITADGISANGNNAGGAGGSVWISAGTLAGAGHISASGNAGMNGTGGGGRIAVYYANASGFTGFNKSTVAGHQRGTACFFDTSAPIWKLSVFDAMAFTNGSTLHLDSVLVTNGGTLTFGSASIVQVDASVSSLGSSTVVLGGGSQLLVNGPLSLLSNSTLLAMGVNVSAPVSNQWLGAGPFIRASGLVVDASSRISADGQGYTTGMGPGGPSGGPGSYGTGGSHGSSGSGGGSGPIYGNALAPTDLGSAGGGWHGGWSQGGGAIRLQVAGTLQLDGHITADGMSANGNNAGGAGGSVWITTGILAGAGGISASGNSGLNGTGGGGRIAVYYSDGTGFAGFTNCLALGNESGTVCFLDSSVPNYRLSVFQNMVFDQDSVLHYGAVLVTNGGVLSIGGGSVLSTDGALIIDGGSTLFALGKNVSGQTSARWAGAGVTLNAGSVVIGPGSKLSADAQGYTTGMGPGGPSGGSGSYTTGGSYGGRGSGGGSPTYGNPGAPADLGSAGGGAYGGWSRGGGAIMLNSAGALIVNGTLSANGFSSGGNNAGGSGGSIWINAGALSGAGSITANGFAGSNAGGGGGRIAIYCPATNAFTGSAQALGAPGGALDGSLYLSASLPVLAIAQHSPIGTVARPVSYVDLTFNSASIPASFTPADVSLLTPTGAMATATMTVTPAGSAAYRVAFPPQTAIGTYELQVGPNIQDLFGGNMASAYLGAFSITSPVITGAVTATNGASVTAVLLTASDGHTVLNQSDGAFSLAVTPGFTGTITPFKTGWVFVPSMRAVTNLSADLAAQTFVAVPGTAAPTLALSNNESQIVLRWYGILGAVYEVQTSGDLIKWTPTGGTFLGQGSLLTPAFNVAPSNTFFRVMLTN